MIRSIPVLGTEPASENWIRSCCCSTPGIRFYCKPVTLVRCREIRGEIRFSGLVGGKWLCEMTSAFIIKELRGARALRLFCGRSSLPPPRHNTVRSKEVQKPSRNRGFFVGDNLTSNFTLYDSFNLMDASRIRVIPVKSPGKRCCQGPATYFWDIVSKTARNPSC